METPPLQNHNTSRTSPGPSWPMLLTITALICGTAALMTHNVYYTEGEIMEGVYAFATAGTAALLLLGFANRGLAAWLIVICGGCLVLWQAYQQRRWAILHEEVVGVLEHIHRIQQKTGNYPATLDGYTFAHPEFKNHISYSLPEGKMSLSYYLNNPGTGYWYHQDSGFGYYPD